MTSDTSDMTSDPSHQFERYPLNQTWHDPLVSDTYHLGEQFEKDRSRIVVPEGVESNIGVRIVRCASSSRAVTPW